MPAPGQPAACTQACARPCRRCAASPGQQGRMPPGGVEPGDQRRRGAVKAAGDALAQWNINQASHQGPQTRPNTKAPRCPTAPLAKIRRSPTHSLAPHLPEDKHAGDHLLQQRLPPGVPVQPAARRGERQRGQVSRSCRLGSLHASCLEPAVALRAAPKAGTDWPKAGAARSAEPGQHTCTARTLPFTPRLPDTPMRRQRGGRPPRQSPARAAAVHRWDANSELLCRLTSSQRLCANAVGHQPIAGSGENR